MRYMMTKKFFHAVALTLVCMWNASGSEDLSEGWKSGELWKMSRTASYSSGEAKIMMRDSDQTKSIARGNLSFCSIPLGEVVFEWKDEEADDADQPEEKESKETTEKKPGALFRVTGMVYNRGDDGEIDAKSFASKVKEVTDTLTEFFGKKPKKPAALAAKAALKTNILQWEDEHGALNLESALSGGKGGSAKKPEFIRIVFAANKSDVAKGNATDKVTKRDLRSSIETDADGTVWIKGIPMVDQGEKGYCVPATVSRVFAYYGMDSVGMHELASLAGADADRGTSSVGMLEALKKIGSRFHVRVKTLPDVSGSTLEAIKEYNKEAKQKGQSALPENTHDRWFDSMDPALWLSVRAKKKTDVKKWFTPIRKNIDLGVPVLWTVFASGLYNREGREGGGAGGAHMRLIIGYNVKKNTLIYSDSWGEWATKREMTIPEAYSVSTGTSVVQP